MKNLIIKKGKKRPFGLHNLNLIKWFNFGRNKFGRSFIFTETAKYNLNDNVAQDRWQKLFGQSFNFSFHHENSARFVFRYNPRTDLFEIGSYVYINGVRKWKLVSSLKCDVKIKLDIIFEENIIFFLVNDEIKDRYILDKNIKNYGYTLGVYFGDSSNRYPNAPHDMRILVDKFF